METKQIAIIIALLIGLAIVTMGIQDKQGVLITDYDKDGKVIQREFLQLESQYFRAGINDYPPIVTRTLPLLPKEATTRTLQLVLENTGKIKITIKITNAEFKASYKVQ